MQGGDFSGLTNAQTGAQIPIFDPLSGGTTQFPNNTIPSTRLNPSPIALGLLPYYPSIAEQRRSTVNN